jgi:hypothetical protein
MGVKTYSHPELIEQKNKILELSNTDVPPGEYTFENVSIVVAGTIPYTSPNLSIEGVPFIKSFLMKLFINGNFGKIFFIFFPFVTFLTRNTYTLTLEFSKDLTSGDRNNFYLVSVFKSPNEENLTIINQRHNLTVHYKYLEDVTFSMLIIKSYIIRQTMIFIYMGSFCESVTINVPE